MSRCVSFIRARVTARCGYEAPAVEPMRAVLRRVAEEHCFSCDARVT
jgi:hypothetical protein